MEVVRIYGWGCETILKWELKKVGDLLGLGVELLEMKEEVREMSIKNKFKRLLTVDDEEYG